MCSPSFDPYDTQRCAEFDDMIQCYGVMNCAYVQGSKIWYFNDPGPLYDNYGHAANDRRSENIGPFDGWCQSLRPIFKLYGPIVWPAQLASLLEFGQQGGKRAIIRSGLRGRPRKNGPNRRGMCKVKSTKR